jgi:hypothetical protein
MCSVTALLLAVGIIQQLLILFFLSEDYAGLLRICEQGLTYSERSVLLMSGRAANERIPLSDRVVQI